MANYEDSPMSTGAWFFTLFVLAIPLLNVIMYIVWACGVGNQSRVTYCRASILWVVLFLIIYIVLSALGVELNLGNRR